jgi:LuxR family maltose regulon positive regulatory protein
MEFFSITPSKIVIPRRRNELVSRPRLLKWFEDITDYKLFIVAAPAGYGKTSLLVDFAHSTELPVCWYSLDAEDQDPLRFFSHFVRCIKNRFDNFGMQSNSILQSMPANKIDPDAIKSIVLNEMFEKILEHFIIILDDVHLVEKSKPVNDFLNDFIQDMDENCHLITSSRTLLNLGDMPIFVAHSQVNGISFAELAFEAEEVTELFKQDFGISLSKEKAESFAQETEGWITGLLLSTQISGYGVSDQLRIARVSGVGLYDYLAQQVFNQQPLNIQKALLRTSLFDEFDAAICTEVVDKALGVSEDWVPILEIILNRNLFVLPVGDEHVHMRYHHLFRDFLQNKMKSNFPFETEKISLALADYFLKNTEWEKAYQIYLNHGQQDKLPELVQLASVDLLKKGRIDILSRWINAIPNPVIDKSAGLLSIKGVVLTSNNDIEEGVIAIEKAERLLKNSSNSFLIMQTLNRLATAYRMKGLYPKAIQTLEKVFPIAQNKPETANLLADSYFILGVTQYFAGEPDESLISLQKALDSYKELKDFNTLYKVEAQIATILRNLGKYSQAEQAYSRALDYGIKLGNIFWQATILNSLGILRQLLGEYEQSLKTFEKALEYARITNSSRERAYTLASIGDLYCEIGAIKEAKDAYQKSRELIRPFEDHFLLQYLDLTQISMQRVQGKLLPALTESEKLLKNAVGSNNVLEINHCHLERGLILIQLGIYQQALDETVNIHAFYKNSGYKLEEVRTSLILLIAYIQLGDIERSRELINEYLKLVENSEYGKMAISSACQVRDPLINSLRKGNETRIAELLWEKIEVFQNNLIHLRNNLRPNAISVPITPISLAIRCFGKTEIRINNEIIPGNKWQAQIARDLFLYLLLCRKGISKEQMGEAFWPGSSQGELKLRFKNAIYRLRRVVGPDMIQFKDDLYIFNQMVEHDVDVLTFKSEILAAEKSGDTESQIEHYENALRVYQGDFLPDVDLLWARVEREELSEKFIKIAMLVAKYKYQTKQFSGAEDLCQRILEKEVFQEDATMLMMRILANRRDKKGVRRYFEKYKKNTDNSPNLKVSDEMDSLYEILTK